MVFRGLGLFFMEVGDEIRALDSIISSSLAWGDSSNSFFFTGLIILLFKGKAVFVFLGEF